MLQVSSEFARTHWRDIVDDAYRGEVVVIERYRKPFVVVLGYDEWQRLAGTKPTETVQVVGRVEGDGVDSE